MWQGSTSRTGVIAWFWAGGPDEEEISGLYRFAPFVGEADGCAIDVGLDDDGADLEERLRVTQHLEDTGRFRLGSLCSSALCGRSHPA